MYLAHNDCVKKVEFLESTLSEASKRYMRTLSTEMSVRWIQLMFGCKEAYTKAVGVGLGAE